MANYLPFNSVLDDDDEPDRPVKAEDWAWYFSTFIGNGVFPNPSDGLQVLADEDMDVTVCDGYGFINGYAFRNPSDYTLTLDTADGSLGRIDRVVLRWDLTNRLMELDVLKGTVSASPTAPDLTQDSDKWELALADISVAAGVTAITQSMITDQRSDEDLCGIVCGVVDQIDFSTLTAQLDAFLEEYSANVVTQYNAYVATLESYESGFEDSMDEWQEEQEEDFGEWFDEMKDQLSEDAAGNLQLEIDEITDDLDIDDEYDYENCGTVWDFMEMITKNDYWAPLADDDGYLIADDDGYCIAGNWSYEVA